jgi:membrane protein required for colicin V production
MNPLDWLLALVLAYSIIRAVLRGFFKEAFSLAGLILGFLLACWFYKSLAASLTGLITNTQLAQFAAFVLIVVATMLVATLIAWLLKRTASAIGLGVVDRILGGVFGLIRGALLCTALLMALTAFLPPAPWIANSTLAPYFLRVSHAASFLMPGDLIAHLREGAAHIKHNSTGLLNPALPSHTDNNSK